MSTTLSSVTPVHITKTVDPRDPDTGGTVSICFTIKRPGLDVVLVQDVSGSMNTQDVSAEGGITRTTRLTASKKAAIVFVSRLQNTDRAAVVPYSTTAHVAQPLTAIKSDVTETITKLKTLDDWYTNISMGIEVAHGELITPPRYVSETIKAIVLLSDGKANRPQGTAADAAREQAHVACQDNIKIYTIGFGSDADEKLLQDIADISGGEYFSAPNGSVLETIYLTIAIELHNLAITDVLLAGVQTDCSQWPDYLCVEGPGGVTTVTFAISDASLISNPLTFCFTATVNLDPGYEGPVNGPGSGFCYQEPEGQTACDEFEPRAIIVGGRKVMGHVFYDANGNGHRDLGEAGAPGIIVRTSTGVITATNVSGSYVLRTSSGSTISVIIEIPPGHVATTPISENIPSATGTYTVDFGIRAEIYLPVIMNNYPPPTNGGFEQRWTGWTHGGTLHQTVSPDNPHSGSFAALLGDPGYRCENGVPIGSAWVEQTFRVPSTVSPTLYFWYNIFTHDKNSALTDTYDSFDVKIDGSRVFRDMNTTSPYKCNNLRNLRWRHATIDLSPFRGADITLRFENWNRFDNWFNIWTYVDDVQVDP